MEQLESDSESDQEIFQYQSVQEFYNSMDFFEILEEEFERTVADQSDN